MPPGEKPDETPAQMKKRAEDLRACARKARTASKALGPMLDGPAKKAQQSNPAIWKGPYAERSTQALTQRKGQLNRMAAALLHDASRWEAEATRLDTEAQKAEKAKKNQPGGDN
ncbi:hypothetical protein [Streptomyces sp. NPDC018031]|uniref:hypothetical protein n=1 Tax=Streptomyces sp. NPDC018031 TaxID=3365033 RepID=UPI0037B6718B